MKLIAIIPARRGSKRLEGKNFRNFFGRPIIEWVLDEIYKSELFDKIVITTDNSEFKPLRMQYGNYIYSRDDIYERPEKLCEYETTVDEVCLDVLKTYKNYDYLCCIYPTAYAVTWKDLCSAFDKMINHDTVSCYSYGMLNGEYDADNGGFYFSQIKHFLQYKQLVSISNFRYELPMIDINTLKDFAEAKIHAIILPCGRFK